MSQNEEKMDKNIRSLYIRVLRGKYDRGRGDPKYMRNIRAEVEWFHNYHQIRHILSADRDCPEEVYMGWSSSRMPGCYKWAQQFLPNPSEEIKRHLEEMENCEKERQKRKEQLNKIKKRREQVIKLKKWIADFTERMRKV